ncbi:MAG: glycerol-3-phosphate acyltransferase [Dehalococcoidales bacterium]|nr:glycerol-3-phosphate acyltransferase [Dehalococcoidales bacterium]
MPWLIVIFSYLLGSMPTSYILGRFKTGRDIRRMGDENAGAANAFRELGSKIGVLVGVIDAVKGSAVILIAQASSMSQPIVLLAGLAAVIGHNWPVFLKFRGGRGVSTTIGVLLVLVTIPMLVLAIPTVAVLVWRRNVTPALAFLFITLPLVDLAFRIEPILIGYGIALPALVGITTFFRTRPKALKQANPQHQ